MSVPTPLPRSDPTRKNQLGHEVSTKISQLTKLYTPTLYSAHQKEDNDDSKSVKLSRTVNLENKIPQISTNNLNANQKFNKFKSPPSNPVNIVNSKFDNLNGSKNNILAETENPNNIININGDLNKQDEIKKKDVHSLNTVVNIEEMSTAKTVKEYVGTARKAFKTGRTKTLEFRKNQLKGLLKFLENHTKEIEDALYKDLRKHKQETNISEIEMVANDLRYTLMELKNWVQPDKPNKRFVNILDEVYIYKDPYGVVLIIGAWNYPILLTLGPLVGALAGGNTVILKPSELVPETNKIIYEILPTYLDKECFQIYLGGVFETTELLKEKFDYIFFTGSSKVGQIVYETAAKTLTPCTLELGGKCPLYLDDSVDMYIAARRILWGRMLNSGQTCVAPDYLLCSKQVEEKFLQEAKKIIETFWGSNPCKSESLSRIVSEKHFKRLSDFIRLGKIALGGQMDPKELLIAPTILTDISPHSLVMEEEIFGPILPIINVKDAGEAIDFINSREKPLALYVFSKNKKTQDMFLNKTSSGGISMNDTISHIGTENLPFGGVGLSGIGSYHGKFGFDTFTHRKGVLVKNFSRLTELTLSIRYPPYSDKKTNLINILLKKRIQLVSSKYLVRCFIFFLGVGFSFLLQYFLNLV